MNTATTPIRRGEVYYIRNYLTTGSEQRGGRPGVVVSNNLINSNSSTIEVVLFTKQSKAESPVHVITELSGSQSTALCEQITTVSKDKIGDYICRLDDATMEKIDKGMLESLSMSYMVKNYTKTITKVEKTDTSALENELALTKAQKDMFEQMYNNLLDKIVGK